MSAIAVRAKLDQRSYRRARVSPDGHSSRLMAQVPRCAAAAAGHGRKARRGGRERTKATKGRGLGEGAAAARLWGHKTISGRRPAPPCA
jgi:hypothetical protein